MLALLLLFLIPFVMATILFCLPRLSAKNIQRGACILSLIPIAFLVAGGDAWHNASFEYAWLPTLAVRFHLSVDHLSLIFLYLTNAIIPIAILSKNPRSITRANVFYGFILLLQGLLIGFFTSKDLVCFTFFFEAILLPLYFLISSWGGPAREKASFKFIIYMVAGSSLMVAGALSLYFGSGSFDIETLAKNAQNLPYAHLIAAIFLLAFAVKTPLSPFMRGFLMPTARPLHLQRYCYLPYYLRLASTVSYAFLLACFPTS